MKRTTDSKDKPVERFYFQNYDQQIGCGIVFILLAVAIPAILNVATRRFPKSTTLQLANTVAAVGLNILIGLGLLISLTTGAVVIFYWLKSRLFARRHDHHYEQDESWSDLMKTPDVYLLPTLHPPVPATSGRGSRSTSLRCCISS